MTDVPELNAAEVEKVLSCPPGETAKRAYSFEINLYEYGGNAHISWNVEIYYAIGPDDKVQLFLGDEPYNSWAVKAHTGSVDTGHNWGTGLSACYWAVDYASRTWKMLVQTPRTRSNS